MQEANGQNIFLYDRKRFEATGSKDVIAFSDESVEMALEEGCLAVDGNELKIESFSSESGKINVTGNVTGISFYGKTPQKSGLFRKKHD